ncbi:hypothetical protein C8J57DRAFT_1039744, partial [Mycena rebaudengoi]
LERERSDIQLALGSITFPRILDIPPQITSEVFLHCPLAQRPDPMEAPLLLAHICSKWRAIAFSTPALW